MAVLHVRVDLSGGRSWSFFHTPTLLVVASSPPHGESGAQVETGKVRRTRGLAGQISYFKVHYRRSDSKC